MPSTTDTLNATNATETEIKKIASRLLSHRQEQYQKYGISSNAQDKKSWLKEGESREDIFTNKLAALVGYPTLTVNPAKQETPWLLDLQVAPGLLGELKTQTTPFYKSKIRNENPLPPELSWTLNVLDVDQWGRRGESPDSIVFFLMVYPESKEYGFYCPGVSALYQATIGEVYALVDGAQSRNKLHREDVGNGRDTRGNKVADYYLDVRNLHLVFRLERRTGDEDEVTETFEMRGSGTIETT